jgi:hypothetical protein
MAFVDECFVESGLLKLPINVAGEDGTAQRHVVASAFQNLKSSKRFCFKVQVHFQG